MARGIKFSGIQFRKDDESGIAQISIFNSTRGTYVVQDDLVDLYTADKVAGNGEYEKFTYWTLLDPSTDTYIVTAQHSGAHNPNSGGSSWPIQVIQYFMTEELNDGEIEVIATTWHTDHLGDTYTYTFTPNTRHETYNIQYFNGDSSTGKFTLNDPHHASQPYLFSKDSGTTWFYPTSYLVSWGTNVPFYNDKRIDANGQFSIVFDDPPDVGIGNVLIKYAPKANKMIIERTIKQPNDGVDFYDYKQNVRLLDDGVEHV